MSRAIALLATVVLSGCGRGNSSPPVARPPDFQLGSTLAAEQTVTRAIDTMPRSLDPTLSTENDAQRVIDDLFEGLTAVGPHGGVVPGVAKSWEVSADGIHWVFHLRPDARWSNGDPVTADDFIYAWQREVDPKTGAEYAQALAPIAGAIAVATRKAPLSALGVSAPDPSTILISLVTPTPYLLDLLANTYMQPLHRATVDRFGDNWTRSEHIVSNGAFLLKEFVVGDRITLEKNPHYWAAAEVHLTRVTYYAIDGFSQLGRYLAGDLEFSSLYPNTQYRWLKSQLGSQVNSAPFLGVVQLSFNMQEPPFSDNRDLRLALSMAVDRKTLAGKFRQGSQEPAFSLIPPLSAYRQQLPEWASWDDARRHAAARRLYAAAGFSATRPFKAQLFYPTSEDNRDLFDAVVAMWHVNLGAEIQPFNEEYRVLLQDERLHKTLLFTNSWIGDFPDPFTFMQLYQSGFEQNFGGYSDAKFDALLDAAAREPDNARRYEYFQRAEARLNSEAPYIPLLFYTSRHLIEPYVRGWELNILDRLPSRYLYVLDHHRG